MRLFQIINILSIDVAIGAVIGSLFFAELYKVDIFPIELAVLFLTVWMIYTIDHLMDAYGLNHLASTKRHRFHQLNFRAIIGSLFIAVILDVILVYFIRRPLYFTGGALSLMICFYFLILRRQEIFKELVGAVLYTSGILLLPLSLSYEMINYEKVIIIFQFGCIVLANLLLFSLFDEQVDRNDKHPSFAVTFGASATRNTLVALFLVGILLSIFQSFWLPFSDEANFVLTLMNGILFLIFANKSYFEKSERYRLLGDGIFLIPFLNTVIC